MGMTSIPTFHDNTSNMMHKFSKSQDNFYNNASRNKLLR